MIAKEEITPAVRTLVKERSDWHKEITRMATEEATREYDEVRAVLGDVELQSAGRKPKGKLPAHRPTIYSEVIVDRVCALIAMGWTIRKIGSVESLPSRTTMLAWLSSGREEHGYFRDQYARAKNLQLEAYAEETLELAEVYKHLPPSSAPELNALKTRIAIRQWLLERLAPKKYGKMRDFESERLAVNVQVVSFLDLPCDPPPDFVPRVLDDYDDTPVIDHDVEDAAEFDEDVDPYDI